MNKTENENAASAEGLKKPVFEPPAGLSYEDEVKWFDAQIAAAERYRGLFTERYFAESKGRIIKDLEKAKFNAGLDNRLAEKPPETTRRRGGIL